VSRQFLECGVYGVRRGAQKHLWCELGLSAVGDCQAFVGGETWLDWTGMFKLNEQVFNVPWHTDAIATICIVPFDINTGKLVSGHVNLWDKSFFPCPNP
jgi:hypothetical protein